MAAPQLAFIGAGRMAAAMIRGLIAQKIYAPAQIACLSQSGDTARQLAATTGITAAADLPALLATADTVVIAFKPQSLASADPRLAELTAGKLVLSVLAGKKLARLAQFFPRARNLVRTMPNTPAAIGAGITPYCSLAPLAATDRSRVEALLGALGQHVALDETHMDAVTAVSGSGPAYLFEFVAALRDGGISAGLPTEIAQKLALQTALGAAQLLAHTGVAPETLRDQVVSPNGTTFAGLQVLAARQFRDTLKDTVAAAARRSEELSRD
jgi:pyrroline-5-carboxylate reductase